MTDAARFYANQDLPRTNLRRRNLFHRDLAVTSIHSGPHRPWRRHFHLLARLLRNCNCQETLLIFPLPRRSAFSAGLTRETAGGVATRPTRSGALSDNGHPA